MFFFKTWHCICAGGDFGLSEGGFAAFCKVFPVFANSGL